jgi:hypothetical protein
MTDHTALPPGRLNGSARFLAFSALAAAVAALAAFSSLSLGFAPWAMFIGWVAYFTRPTSARQGVYTYAALVCGLVFGVFAVLALGALSPVMGTFAIAAVVFVVAVIVVSMRAIPALDNIPAWFLGLIAFFASHLEPALLSIVELATASAIGAFAGWGSQQLQRRWTPAH